MASREIALTQGCASNPSTNGRPPITLSVTDTVAVQRELEMTSNSSMRAVALLLGGVPFSTPSEFASPKPYCRRSDRCPYLCNRGRSWSPRTTLPTYTPSLMTWRLRRKGSIHVLSRGMIMVVESVAIEEEVALLPSHDSIPSREIRSSADHP